MTQCFVQFCKKDYLMQCEKQYCCAHGGKKYLLILTATEPSLAANK